MSALESMFIEAGGEEAAELGGIAVHGRVGLEGEAEELEFNVGLLNASFGAELIRSFKV